MLCELMKLISVFKEKDTQYPGQLKVAFDNKTEIFTDSKKLEKFIKTLDKIRISNEKNPLTDEIREL